MAIKSDPALKAAVDQAFDTEGYLRNGGTRDLDKMRQQALGVLSAAKVLRKTERPTKAVTKGSLVRQVFSHLPDPEKFASQKDPDLAEAVWDEIQRILWGEAKPDATGKLQVLIGAHMGNGYVLCRTKIGDDRTDAAYITDDRACIELDFVIPEQEALERKIRSVAGNRAMLIYRQPQNAKRWKQTFDHHLKAVTASSSAQLALALEGVTTSSDITDDEDGQDDQDNED